MNILWICTDQQRYDTLGCYGNKYVKTPNIDRLAAMGMRFDRAYCQSPVCAPSRASFLTGRYPRTCRLRQNGQDIPSDELLIPKVLADNGYMCGLSGKLHISACNQAACKVMEPRVNDGYHYFRWSHHPGSINSRNNWPMNDYTMWLTSKGVKYETGAREDCKYVQTGMPEQYHQSTWCTDKALECMESARSYDTPWMFSINYYDPHHSFDPPKEYLDRYMDILDEIPLPNYISGELAKKPVFQQKDHGGAYDSPGNFSFAGMTDYDHRMLKAAYWAMVDLIDVQVGRLLNYLEESNQLNDTLIIFTSDHGENLGDHGMYLKGPYFYENNVRVPLIFAMPDTIPTGAVSGALVELVDIAPTLCDAAGLNIPPGVQGKSLWQMLTGKASDSFHRESVYCEYYNSNIKHRDPLAFATMVCDGRYKLVRIHDKNHEQKIIGELYDLQAQPPERENLYGNPDYSQVQTRMLELLCDRMAETCDPLPVRRSCW